MDFNPVPFNFGLGLVWWLATVAVVAVATLGMSLIVSMARNGVGVGKRSFSRGLTSYAED